MDLTERPSDSGQRHPWEEARFQFFWRLLARSINLQAVGAALDVGAGDAWFAMQLAACSNVRRIVCWDTGYTPELLESRRLREITQVELTANRPTTQFDLLLMLDVLEHVDDDDDLLARVVGDNLVPGGHALVSVPAWPSVFSSHDVRLRHCRRYTPASARALLRTAGLELLRSGGLFHTLLLARALQVGRERVFRRPAFPPHAAQWSAPSLVTAFIRGVLMCEGRLSLTASGLDGDLPGLSWWALCRKPLR